VEPYHVYLNIDLLEVVPKTGRHRQEIMKFIYSLRDRPRTKGDYTDKDASLQVRQIKIIGDYAITYWLDDAVRSVMAGGAPALQFCWFQFQSHLGSAVTFPYPSAA
jgi:hypothetical protein